ncbi:MAG: tetratricopeptide repeat protein, partial [Actinomycetota bacterium]
MSNPLILEGRERPEDTVSWCKQDLAACRARGDLHGEARTLDGLGVVYRNQGRWVKAAYCYVHSLEIRRALRDRPGKAQTLNNLGIVYRNQGRLSEAASCYEHSLS